MFQIRYYVHDFNHPVPAARQNVNNLRCWTKLALRWDSIVANDLGAWQNQVAPLNQNQFATLSQNQIAALNLHGLRVQFPSGANGVLNPHYHVLGWHYVQCVMRKWAAQAYMQFPNINW